MKLRALPALAALALAIHSAAAQTPAPTAAPAPSGAPKDPLGFGGLTKNRPAGSKTEIVAQKEATFNDSKNQATFVGDVRVKDPTFLLSSDKLTVYLTKQRSGIEKAVAEGNVVIVQQTDSPTEKGAIGRARVAEYFPATGTVTLIGWPEVEQGINRHVAASQETRMTMDRTGKATTDGPSRTVITDKTETPFLP